MQYIWLIWSLILVIIWSVIYLFQRSKVERREMLIVSAWTSLLGLTEPLFVPEYWSPPSLFDLALQTGFDIESLIFAFAAGGIVFSLYQLFLHKKHAHMSEMSHNASRHRFHYVVMLSVPVLIIGMLVGTNLNPIYDFIIAGLVGGLLSWYCRPDLEKKMVVSAGLFLGLYYVYFLTLIAMSPDYVERIWNLKALSGILITGIPLEELLFAIMLGFYWSSVYEHLTWQKIKSTKQI